MTQWWVGAKQYNFKWSSEKKIKNCAFFKKMRKKYVVGG